MKEYTLYRPGSGVIEQDGAAFDWADVVRLANTRGLRAIEGRYSGREFYVASENPLQVEPRPRLNVPATKRVAPGSEWKVPAQAGTEVWIDGVRTATAQGGGNSLTLRFEIPGDYYLRFVPPLPAEEVSTVVTVAP